MKKLKDVILEKLNVKNLNLDVTKEKYTYDEFIDLISDIIDIDITKNDFHTCITYYLNNAKIDIEDISFIDITDSIEEVNFFKKYIYSKKTNNLDDFLKSYCIKYKNSNYFLHYINTSEQNYYNKPNNEYNLYRFCYIKNNTYKIFKLKK